MLVDIYRNANGTLTDDVRAASLLTGIMSSCILYADMSARHSELPACAGSQRVYQLSLCGKDLAGRAGQRDLRQ